MNILSLVIQREYLTGKKTLLYHHDAAMPLLMVAISFVPLWLSTLNDGSVKHIVVIDNTGIYAPLLKSTDSTVSRSSVMHNRAIISQKSGESCSPYCSHRRPEQCRHAVTILSEKQAPQELEVW